MFRRDATASPPLERRGYKYTPYMTLQHVQQIVLLELLFSVYLVLHSPFFFEPEPSHGDWALGGHSHFLWPSSSHNDS